MINVDHHRRTYCGGCLDVCPVGSPTLAETRLVLSDNCIDGGDYVPACPVGALQLEPQVPAGRTSRGRAHDVVVVGVGSGGSTAARVCAGCRRMSTSKMEKVKGPCRVVGPPRLSQVCRARCVYTGRDTDQ